MKTPDEELKQFGWILHGVGFLVTVAGCFMAFAFVVTPLQTRLTGAQREAKQLEVFLDRSDKVVTREANLRKQLESSRHELSELQNRVPKTPQANEFLQHLDQLAKQTGLTILDYQPGRTIDNETHSETRIEMSGKGQFESLCQFLDGLAELPRLCRIRTMQILSVSEGDEYPIDLSLSIYFSDSDSFVRIEPAATSRIADVAPPTY